MIRPPHADPVACLLAGFLQAESWRTESIEERLPDWLNPSCLWFRANEGPSPAIEPDRLPPPPLWVTPRTLDAATWISLAETGRRWLATAALPPDRIIRIRVDSTESADNVVAWCSGATGWRVAPFVERWRPRFRWQWPLRIAFDGPGTATWLADLARSSHAGNIFDIVPPTEEAELIVVRDEGADASRWGSATGVVLVGDAPGSRLLEALMSSHNAIGVGLPTRDGDMPPVAAVVDELAHDLPLDAALAIVAPDARVTGPAQLIDLTAVGRWAIAVGMPTSGLRFDRESSGASVLSSLSRTRPGGSPRIDIRWAMADAAPPVMRDMESARAMAPDVEPGPPPPVAAGLPPPTVAPNRSLIGEFMRGDDVVEDVLAPSTDHYLVVLIAVPTEEQRKRSVTFDDASVPDLGGMTKLTVEVSSDELKLHASADIHLPTSDRSAPSTLALFPVHVPATESSFAVRILVLHEGRPLQAAALTGNIRSKAVRGDAIRMSTLHLSASPEPRPKPTSADVTLETRLRVLRRVGGSDRMAVDVAEVERWLDEAEKIASTFLTAKDAPTSLSDQKAKNLLVGLARCGADLRTSMRKLRIDRESTIAILVEGNTRVWPFELAYDGPMPREEARLCTEADGEHARPGSAGHASEDVVCPWAFWGLSRVIARTFELDEPVPEGADVPLSLRPVLYAAAARADDGSAAGKGPSHDLERAIKKLAGKSFQRVQAWDKWEACVREDEPQLLVLLAHSDTSGGVLSLEIGKNDVLKRHDVQPRMVRAGSGPKPLVLLLACSGASVLDTFGGLPAAFTGGGAAAVVATLSKLRGRQGAQAAAQVVEELHAAGTTEGVTLGAALARARRKLVESGNLLGLLLVSHGEIDVRLSK